MKRALITGVTGQDGSYLAELLLSKGYEVHGLVRHVSLDQADRNGNLKLAREVGGERFHLHYGDLSDGASLRAVVAEVRPDEVYNLAAQSHVGVSFELPEHTGDVTGLGVMRLLEAIRKAGLTETRFYQASSSELFGEVAESPQRETTLINPRSPYAAAKAYAYYATRNYREAYGMFAVNGILFNHESERRPEAFVTRKITRAAARISLGLQDELVLGNIESRRDWGHAEDYVDAMWRMLQADRPDDYVVGTGETHSVREFCEAAFGALELDWHTYVRSDDKFLRPSEVDLLLADPGKARQVLGWRPRIRFGELVARMVQHDLSLARIEKAERERAGAFQGRFIRTRRTEPPAQGA